MMYLSDDKQADTIEAFNTKYLDDILNKIFLTIW